MNICPGCNQPVLVTKPSGGGYIIVDGERWHLQCFIDAQQEESED